MVPFRPAGTSTSTSFALRVLCKANDRSLNNEIEPVPYFNRRLLGKVDVVFHHDKTWPNHDIHVANVRSCIGDNGKGEGSGSIQSKPHFRVDLDDAKYSYYVAEVLPSICTRSKVHEIPGMEVNLPTYPNPQVPSDDKSLPTAI